MTIHPSTRSHPRTGISQQTPDTSMVQIHYDTRNIALNDAKKFVKKTQRTWESYHGVNEKISRLLQGIISSKSPSRQQIRELTEISEKVVVHMLPKEPALKEQASTLCKLLSQGSEECIKTAESVELMQSQVSMEVQALKSQLDVVQGYLKRQQPEDSSRSTESIVRQVSQTVSKWLDRSTHPVVDTLASLANQVFITETVATNLSSTEASPVPPSSPTNGNSSHQHFFEEPCKSS